MGNALKGEKDYKFNASIKLGFISQVVILVLNFK